MALHPPVSVIMTVYNAEKYVKQAIDSILNQSLNDFEFVIVDDGSDDRTPIILDEAEKDQRVKIITKQRIGRGPALNIAWSNSAGLYIANIDADDLAEPNRLKTQLKFLQENPEIGLLGSACSVINEDGFNQKVIHQPLRNTQLQRALINSNPFVHSAVMMPRHVLEELGGYNEKIPVTIDYELWVRIAKSYKIANLDDILTIKRVSNSAYFRNKIPSWVRYKSHIFLRWAAWKNHPNNLLDLRFVVSSIVRYIIAKTTSLLKLTNVTVSKDR